MSVVLSDYPPPHWQPYVVTNSCKHEMQGFEPDDFVTGQRGVHPDMAQPGPGRGTDWDSMFG